MSAKLNCFCSCWVRTRGRLPAVGRLCLQVLTVARLCSHVGKGPQGWKRFWTKRPDNVICPKARPKDPFGEVLLWRLLRRKDVAQTTSS
jgi:hypothetical protein